MGTTRIVASVNNRALSATLKNGTGGGAPALVQATGYPMSNALLKGRYNPWVWPSGASSPVDIDIDLGSDLSILAIGLHGVSVLSGSLTQVQIKYSTAAEGYTPGGGAHTYTTISGSSFTNDRDVCAVSTATMRYVNFHFLHSSAILSIGKLFLTAIITDLGFIYWPGSTETDVRFDQETQNPAGQPSIATYPDMGKTWQMQLSTITGTTLTTLRAIASSGDPFSMIDENANLEEVRLLDKQVQASRLYAGASVPTSVWNATLNLARLP